MPDAPQTLTAFSSEGPIGLWEPSKINQTFDGGIGLVGGSNPSEGKGPWDEFSNVTSSAGFFGQQVMADRYPGL